MDPSCKPAREANSFISAAWQNSLACGAAAGYLFGPAVGLTCAAVNGVFAQYRAQEPWFPPIDDKVIAEVKEIWDKNHWFKINLIMGVVMRALNVSLNQVAIVYAKSAVGSPLKMLIVFARACALTPLLEEVLFRGFLQDRIKDIQIYLFGEKEAGGELQKILRIFAQAIVFGLCHSNPKHGASDRSIVIGTGTAGLLLGIAKEENKGLWSPCFLHGYMNASTVARVFLFGV